MKTRSALWLRLQTMTLRLTTPAGGPGRLTKFPSDRLRRALLVGMLAAALGQGAFEARSDQYTINIQPGYNLIANQLDHGSNTLDEVLPGVPDGCVLYKYTNNSNRWSVSSFSAMAGRWLNGDAITLSPGEGAFLSSPSAFALTFTGSPHVPVLPVNIPAGRVYLLSRQANDVATYEDIVGASPSDGTMLYRWKGGGYEAYTYDELAGAWSPFTPAAAIGESVWISGPGGGSAPQAPTAGGLTVLSPTNGDSFCAGSTQTITWSGGNPSWNVLISLVDVPAWTVYSIITPSTPNNGSFVWTIPQNVPPSTYLIYIQEVSVTTWTYGGNFTIVNCPTNPCVPPPPGLTLWLPFDETTGPTRANLAPGGNPGTLVNGPFVTGGYVSNSLTFNGVNQLVTVPDYASINPGAGQDFSIDAWVRRATNSPNSPPSVIVDKRDPNTGVGYSLALSFGRLVLQMNDGSGFSNYPDTAIIPADDRWHLAAVTVVRSLTSGGQFYVDGLPTALFDPTGRPGNLANTAPFQVAASPIGGNVPWRGGIDEVEFFRRALVPAEVYSIFSAGPAGKCKQPCGESLLVTCPTNKTVECGTGWSFDPPLASDPTCTNISIRLISSNGVPLAPCGILWSGVWEVTGCCSNVVTCTQTVAVVDTLPPTINCGQNETLTCGLSWDFTVPIVTDNCGAGGVNLQIVSTTTNSGCPFRATRVWQATDACGNSTTCTQIVTVLDYEPPVIICAPDKTVECGAFWRFDPPTAYDACCGTNVTISIVGTITNSDPANLCAQQIIRRWRAVDCCQNASVCDQTVTVVDTMPPVLSTLCVTNLVAFGGNNFASPLPAYPSAGLMSRLLTAGVTQFKGFDECTTDTYFAHTFTNLPPCITSARLTIRLKPCGGICENDSIGLSFTDASGTLQTNANWGRYLGGGNSSPGLFPDDWCNHVNGEVLVLDLSALPQPSGPPLNLLPALNLNGFLDVTSQDDTGIDYAILEVVSCCCAPSKTVECGTGWNFDPPQAFDACCGSNVTITVLSTVTSSDPANPCSQAITRTWEITDCCSNSITCRQTVTVVDTTPPVITCAPGKGVICGTPWDFDPPEAFDLCCPEMPVITVLNTVTNGHGCDLIITRTWMARDCCGNTATCSQTIQVGDPEPPVLTCAPDKTVECNTPWLFDPPTAYDLCCGTNVIIKELSTVAINTGQGPCREVFQRVWEAIDCCGNSTTCTQTVSTVDTTPPGFTCMPFYFEAGTTADDFTGPEPSSPSPGLLLRLAAANLKGFDDCTIDAAVAHTFANLPPCITKARLTMRLKPCGSLCCNDTVALFFTDASGALVPGSGTWGRGLGTSAGCSTAPGLFADDWCNHTGGEVISLDLAALPLAGGGFTNLLADLNANGFLDFALQDDSAIDYLTLEVLSCCCSTTNRVECGTEWTFIPPAAIDNCCGTNVTVTALSTVTNVVPGQLCQQEIVRTWLATDCCGNTNTCTQTVIVVDTAPPIIQCVPDKTVECNTQWAFDPPVAFDRCCGTNVTVVELSTTITNLVPCTRRVTRTWEARDCCGHSAICSQTVTVVDSTPPVITCAPGKGVICGTPWDFDPPEAFDLCCPEKPVITVLNTVTNGHGCDLIITRTWMASDCCGNAATCSQSIQVIDNTPPTVDCPRNKRVPCGTDWRFDLPRAYDECCGDKVTITPVSTVTNGICPLYSITRTWEIADCCGNSVTCSQTVTLTPCTPAPQGFTLWLPLDETTGVTSLNLYSGGNQGTHVNAPTPGSGYVNHSLCFDGTQSVVVPDYPAINPGTNDLSIDAWVKRSSLTGNEVRVIVDKRDPNTGIGYSLSISYGNLILQLADSGGFTNYRDTLGVIPPDDQWHFVAVTVNRGSTTGGQFYVDGVPTDTFDPTGQSGSLDNTGAFQVAASPIGGNNPWLGCIDEVEFFPRVLTAAEVLSIFEAGSAGKCKPLLVCSPDKGIFLCNGDWQFDPPQINAPCCGTNVTLTVVGTTTNLWGPAGDCILAITRRWELIDCCNQVAFCSQTVYVIKPAATLIPAPDKTVECGTAWSFDPPAMVSDPCSCTNSPVIVGTVTNGFCPQRISATWQVYCCGGISTCTQTVTVVDTRPPVITCAPNKTVICGTPWSYDLPTAVDACCSNVAIVTGITFIITNGCETTFTRYWRAVDCCGNESPQCAQTVKVIKPPCGPVVISSVTYSGGNVILSFPTQPCLIYDVEYRNNLGIFTPWLPLTTVNGTGGIVTVTDSVGPGHKFYRVRCRCE